VLVPAGEIEVGHCDVFVGFLESPGAAGRAAQPIGHMSGQRRRQTPDDATPGHESEQFPAPAAFPLLRGRGRGVRRGQAHATPQVRGNRGQPPVDAPARPESARPVDARQFGGDRDGAHGLQVRRSQSGKAEIRLRAGRPRRAWRPPHRCRPECPERQCLLSFSRCERPASAPVTRGCCPGWKA
jgi:hypothetical protein